MSLERAVSAMFVVFLNGFLLSTFVLHVWAPFVPGGFGVAGLWIPLWPTLLALVRNAGADAPPSVRFCRMGLLAGVLLAGTALTGIANWRLKTWRQAKATSYEH